MKWLAEEILQAFGGWTVESFIQWLFSNSFTVPGFAALVALALFALLLHWIAKYQGKVRRLRYCHANLLHAAGTAFDQSDNSEQFVGHLARTLDQNAALFREAGLPPPSSSDLALILRP